MQVNISGHHVELTQALKDYTTEKLAKIDRHFQEVSRINVILSVEKHFQKAEANLHFLGMDFSAEDLNEDLYRSVDNVVDKLDKQLNKHREKIKKVRPVG